MRLLAPLVLTVASCSADPRTDWERANDIELTPEQIEVREYNARERRRAAGFDLLQVQERMRMQRMISCHTGNYLDCVN